MPSQVRWTSMPRVPRLEDEEDNDLTETGSESIDISLSSEDNDGPEGRRRGPNYGTNGRADESGRTPLTVGDSRFITPSASRAVSANLKSYLGGPYPTYSFVPVDIKKLLRERFQQQYSWPKNKENEVEKAKENSGSENIADWMGYGPPWLSAEHWNEIIEKQWNNEGWKKKSKFGRDNRLTIKSGTISKHTTGSITIATHKLRLHDKLGKPPTASQLFDRIHRRNKGEGDFVDNKSRIVYETYDNAINEKYGSNASSHPEIDIEAWCEASQGPCKSGRLFGLGLHRPILHKVGISNPYDGVHADFSILQEEFRGACEKIDQLTRENDDLIRRTEDGRLV